MEKFCKWVIFFCLSKDNIYNIYNILGIMLSVMRI